MNSSAGLEAIEKSNYYPFGLKHRGYNALAGNPAYQYQYNGKELQKESGMYDYGARFYMPDLGRWGMVDPLAEKDRRWTPYRYAYNNPVIFIDPDGRNEDWYENIETNNKEWFDGNKEIEGYKHLGNSVQDGNLNYASDGKVYDDSPEGKGQEINPETNIKEISITKEKSFDLMRWISGLGNNKETFYSFSGGTNDPDAETLKKLRPGDNIEANNMFEYIINGYGRAIKSVNLSPDSFQAGIDGLSIIGLTDIFKSNDSINISATLFYPYPHDTIKTVSEKKMSEGRQNLQKKVDSINDVEYKKGWHFKTYGW